MVVRVIALLEIREDESFALGEYFRITNPLLERANARIVSRFEVNQAVVGHPPPRTIVVVEYPDLDAVKSVFDSPEYASIARIRDVAFSSYSVSLVEEVLH